MRDRERECKGDKSISKLCLLPGSLDVVESWEVFLKLRLFSQTKSGGHRLQYQFNLGLEN